MSLSTAFNIAQNTLLNTGRQSSVVSRNVQESTNSDYTRRTASLVSTSTGARYVGVERATNDLLFRQNMAALSAWSGQSTLKNGLDQLELSVQGVDNGSSSASAIAELQKALQLYSATPSNRSLAQAAVEAARLVVSSLNDGTDAIQNFRTQTDQQITAAVNELNTLLTQFKEVNDQVINGTTAGRDVSDALDRRDTILKQISSYVPITTMVRGQNDMVLTTKDGATLFEAVPRSVTFQSTNVFGAVTTGNPVYIDGMPIKLSPGGNTDVTGRLSGLVQLRDSVTTTMQAQLDEVARGLITAFRETDQTGGAAPDAAGLFTWSGAPAIPPAGTVVTGLAGAIKINTLFDATTGGNPELLRDGGANGAAYVANTAGVASYSALILRYADRIDATMTFDTAAGAGSGVSLASYASIAVGWFEGVRKDADSAATNKEALASRSAEALSNATGVNVDTEMSLLLDLEHSYQASSRLIKAVDDMFAMLFAAAG